MRMIDYLMFFLLGVCVGAIFVNWDNKRKELK